MISFSLIFNLSGKKLLQTENIHSPRLAFLHIFRKFLHINIFEFAKMVKKLNVLDTLK